MTTPHDETNDETNDEREEYAGYLGEEGDDNPMYDLEELEDAFILDQGDR